MNRDPSENGRHNVVKVGEMDDRREKQMDGKKMNSQYQQRVQAFLSIATEL